MSYTAIRDAVWLMTGRSDIDDTKMRRLVLNTVNRVQAEYLWHQDLDVWGYHPSNASEEYEGFASARHRKILVVFAVYQDGSRQRLRKVTPRELLDNPTPCFANDTYYEAANSLYYRTSRPIEYIEWHAYVRPDTHLDSYHWTTERMPETIIAGTCAAIYRMIGEPDTYAMYENEFLRLLAIAKATEADVGGLTP